jgi:phosphate transport system permease protein
MNDSASVRIWKDRVAHKTMLVLCASVLGLAFLMAFGLLHRAAPILAVRSLGDLLFSPTWSPARGHFGLAVFIAGTLWVTAIAMILAVPFSLLTAIYMAEYAPRIVTALLRPVVDLLAGISPVIYGTWGMIALVPLVRDSLMPYLSEHYPFFPFASDNYTGFTALTAGIVLAIMIAPIIISIVDEVIRNVPDEIRHASLALGATHWQTVKHAVLRKAWPGIIAAIILALSRAFGETMAVLMVAGCNLHGMPKSVFDAAYPLPALIANTYGEMMSIPLYDAAVLLAALMLLAVTTFFNMIGWGILLRQERKAA